MNFFSIRVWLASQSFNMCNRIGNFRLQKLDNNGMAEFKLPRASLLSRPVGLEESDAFKMPLTLQGNIIRCGFSILTKRDKSGPIVNC